MFYHFLFRYNQLWPWPGLAHTEFAAETFFKTSELLHSFSCSFHVILCWNDAVLDRKLILLRVENIRFMGLSIKKKHQEELKDVIYQKVAEILPDRIFIFLLTFKNVANPSHNCKWLFLKKKKKKKKNIYIYIYIYTHTHTQSETLARWSYHYHLSTFTCTIQMTG